MPKSHFQNRWWVKVVCERSHFHKFTPLKKCEMITCIASLVKKMLIQWMPEEANCTRKDSSKQSFFFFMKNVECSYPFFLVVFKKWKLEDVSKFLKTNCLGKFYKNMEWAIIFSHVRGIVLSVVVASNFFHAKFFYLPIKHWIFSFMS